MRVTVAPHVLAFAGLEGDARPAFGRDRYHVRFDRPHGSITPATDYCFGASELLALPERPSQRPR